MECSSKELTMFRSPRVVGWDRNADLMQYKECRNERRFAGPSRLISRVLVVDLAADEEEHKQRLKIEAY